MIVPFLNAERFLQETVESVLAQSYHGWELLLIDDGSSDGSSEMARGYAAAHPERVRYLTHPGHENRGMCASRNLAIREARGTLIAPLDSDDVWLPTKLERQVAILEAHPEVGMVFGAALYWSSWSDAKASVPDDVQGRPGPLDVVRQPPELLLSLYPIGPGNSPCPSDVLLRRELVEQIGGFEESFRAVREFYEDQAFFAKVYLAVPCYVSSDCWTRYRFHEYSCSAESIRAGLNEVARQFYFNWLERYLAEKGIHRGVVRKAVHRAHWSHRHPKYAQVRDSVEKALRKPGKLIGSLQRLLSRSLASR